MKEDLKDILAIPAHVLNSEKATEKEEKSKSKEESRKNNLACKDALNVTKGLFPLKVGRILTSSKRNMMGDFDDNRWIWSKIKFCEEEDVSKPNIMHWVQNKNTNKLFKFTKYNLPLSLPSFTSDEYDAHLAGLDLSWKKEETLYLWDMLKRFEMRFFVVYDRYDTEKYPRTLDELKQRFYSIARELAIIRNQKESPYLNYAFDINYERHRKYQLEKYVLRGKDKNEEEKALNEELKKLDLLIKKKEREQKNLKKMMSVANEPGNIEKMQDMIDQVENQQHSIFQKNEKCVYLRGSVMHGALPSLSSKLNKKIESVMKELSIPENPMPTQQVHSMYDTLRKNILKMFSLQISLKTKEEERKRLAEKIEKEKEREKEKEMLRKRPNPSQDYGHHGHHGHADGRSNKKIKNK